MEKLIIYYSVSNGGDGSAYPYWMESKELAKWDQDHMSEGWGESCTGSITITGENITVENEVITKEKYLFNYIKDEILYGYKRDNNSKEFFKAFFKDIPIFKVTTSDKVCRSDDYTYVTIICEKSKFDEFIKVSEISSLEKNLNRIVNELGGR